MESSRSSNQWSNLIIQDTRRKKHLPELWHSQNHITLADGCEGSPITQNHTSGQFSQELWIQPYMITTLYLRAITLNSKR
jgi:hypothetical protein